MSGVVTAFDEHEGLGSIALDDGEEVGFHATQLADGTRAIETGTRVVASVVPWHRGRREATDVTVRDPARRAAG
ncbi:MAG TPA: cold shock domain-containing protein [Acidimicrobiales bacterium]|nr:cold shock domain-containing protein [Acidimicrobiales bacterium]